MMMKRGDKGVGVKHVQEWLSLHGYAVTLDGSYGPATEAAVSKFQNANSIPATGNVDDATMAALCSPLTRAMAKMPPYASIAQTVVAVAVKHLAERPREVGGQNMGPWCRAYMDEHEGDAWPWCAGFVWTVVHQATSLFGIKPPIKKTYSCTELGKSSALLQAPHPSIAPGAIFLLRKKGGGHMHTGIVTKVEKEFYETIEGNTNDAGEREGIAVMARIRGFKNTDFIAIA